MKNSIVFLSFIFWSVPLPMQAQTLCPDGSYIGGVSCSLAPDGKYVGGDPELAPDGTYVGGEPKLVPEGSCVGDSAEEN